MGALKEAIKQERWEVAALCLVIGFLQVVTQVPPDALPGLLEALEEGGDHARR